ncbi:hypothetical protein [uncultured Lutibacter sp.]|uniref:hypothetical protein n=1 Tax=uncultured Lutibacter sp. TaxID=437739 RepID=UPI002608BAFE|nr:hypothetical protein [uncultured Lutibacter sp.]
MKKSLIFVISLFLFSQLNAQFIKSTSVDISAGLGITVPYDNVDIESYGFYLQGEYVLNSSYWIDFRTYAGLILTKTEIDKQQNEPAYKSDARAFLIGGKTRISPPFRRFAPFFEIGIGASFGSFETFTPFTFKKDSGVQLHIPFSLGVELGYYRNYELSLKYYYHPNMKQFSGATAVGISIPLSN